MNQFDSMTESASMASFSLLSTIQEAMKIAESHFADESDFGYSLTAEDMEYEDMTCDQLEETAFTRSQSRYQRRNGFHHYNLLQDAVLTSIDSMQEEVQEVIPTSSAWNVPMHEAALPIAMPVKTSLKRGREEDVSDKWSPESMFLSSLKVPEQSLYSMLTSCKMARHSSGSVSIEGSMSL
jgi:hypothetical protein